MRNGGRAIFVTEKSADFPTHPPLFYFSDIYIAECKVRTIMADPGNPLPFEGLNAGQLEILHPRRATDIEECFLPSLALLFRHILHETNVFCGSNRLPCCAGVFFQ